jgi:hypothetical protein
MFVLSPKPDHHSLAPLCPSKPQGRSLRQERQIARRRRLQGSTCSLLSGSTKEARCSCVSLLVWAVNWGNQKVSAECVRGPGCLWRSLESFSCLLQGLERVDTQVPSRRSLGRTTSCHRRVPGAMSQACAGKLVE